MKLISKEKIEGEKNNDFILAFSFNTNNVRLDSKEQKINLFPITKKREDYVQSELRRLRESLKSESSKMHRPQQLRVLNSFIISIFVFFLLFSKAHEPFVYNDLSPYFDTSPVEKAIHAVIENTFFSKKSSRSFFFLLAIGNSSWLLHTFNRPSCC